MKQSEMTQENKDKAFNTLYTSYPYTKVNSYDDCLVYYNILIGDCYKVQDELNAVILEHKLPLEVKTNSRNGIFTDTVVVTIKETSNEIM